MAEDIEDALEMGRVDRVLSKVSPDGTVTTYRLDKTGKIEGTWP